MQSWCETFWHDDVTGGQKWRQRPSFRPRKPFRIMSMWLFWVRFVACFPACVKTKTSASMPLTLSMLSAQRLCLGFLLQICLAGQLACQDFGTNCCQGGISPGCSKLNAHYQRVHRFFSSEIHFGQVLRDEQKITSEHRLAKGIHIHNGNAEVQWLKRCVESIVEQTSTPRAHGAWM